MPQIDRPSSFPDVTNLQAKQRWGTGNNILQVAAQSLAGCLMGTVSPCCPAGAQVLRIPGPLELVSSHLSILEC